tara:strand:+ start:76 stop:609 length:534 start_codon:yes stop_codon:yes gene_type:complete
MKKRTDLNTFAYWETEEYRSKKQKYKSHEHFHYRGEIKIAGKENEICECHECYKLLPTMAFTTSGKTRGDASYYLRKICRECHTVIITEQRNARKNAPPHSEHCECCHKKTEKLQVDHLHGSTTFRGWLCRQCNTGLGGLGDDLEGVLQGAIYLENDKDKIIETLNKVFDEMFARTT